MTLRLFLNFKNRINTKDIVDSVKNAYFLKLKYGPVNHLPIKDDASLFVYSTKCPSFPPYLDRQLLRLTCMDIFNVDKIKDLAKHPTDIVFINDAQDFEDIISVTEFLDRGKYVIVNASYDDVNDTKIFNVLKLLPYSTDVSITRQTISSMRIKNSTPYVV
jgi:hypothetical protein